MAITNIVSNAQDQSVANPSWTHTPTGTPAGVIVITSERFDFIGVTAVTYGGTSMTEITGSPHQHTTGETGQVTVWFLGSSVPTGAQTVAVTGGAIQRAMVSYTMSASGDMVIQDTDATINSDSVLEPSATLSLGSNNCFCAFGWGSGRTGSLTPLTDWTVDQSLIFSSQIGAVSSYDIIDSTDVTMGWSQGTADDAFALGIAIREDAVSPTLDQEGFHFRDDDGSETSASFRGAQDSNITAPILENIRLRMLINSTGNPDSGQYQIEYKVSSADDSTYVKIV